MSHSMMRLLNTGENMVMPEGDESGSSTVVGDVS